MIGRLETAEGCTYLGKQLAQRQSMRKEFEGMGWNPVGKYGYAVNSNPPFPLTRKVHNQCVLPFVVYGSETSHLTKEQQKKTKECTKRNGQNNVAYYME